MFAQRQPAALRQRLEQLQQDFKLKNVSEADYKAAAVEILTALKKLKEKA